MKPWFAAAGLLSALLASEAQAQSTQTYRYDTQGQLVGVSTAAPTTVIATYAYDDAGNRTSRQAYNLGTPSLSYRMNGGDNLVPTQMMVSQDSRFTLWLQPDGNLTLNFGATLLWSTATATGSALYFQMQGDGNAVLYDYTFTPLWASGTGGNSGAYLTLQNDGNLVLRNAAGTVVLWASNTCCH